MMYGLVTGRARHLTADRRVPRMAVHCDWLEEHERNVGIKFANYRID